MRSFYLIFFLIHGMALFGNMQTASAQAEMKNKDIFVRLVTLRDLAVSSSGVSAKPSESICVLVAAPNHILCSRHHVEHARAMMVFVGGEQTPRKAALYFADPQSDIALLSVEGVDREPAFSNESDAVSFAAIRNGAVYVETGKSVTNDKKHDVRVFLDDHGKMIHFASQKQIADQSAVQRVLRRASLFGAKSSAYREGEAAALSLLFADSAPDVRSYARQDYSARAFALFSIAAWKTAFSSDTLAAKKLRAWASERASAAVAIEPSTREAFQLAPILRGEVNRATSTNTSNEDVTPLWKRPSVVENDEPPMFHLEGSFTTGDTESLGFTAGFGLYVGRDFLRFTSDSFSFAGGLGARFSGIFRNGAHIFVHAGPRVTLYFGADYQGFFVGGAYEPYWMYNSDFNSFNFETMNAGIGYQAYRWFINAEYFSFRTPEEDSIADSGFHWRKTHALRICWGGRL